ncbi:MAG: DUF1998 domain-containing protein, partial [Desulfobacterales bacterium]|nr:DUF1998 domain-containing protein [Desulfobacterales bacterium]
HGTRMGFGRLKITEQVTGYDRKRVSTGKSIGIVPLDLPELTFETHGIWIEIPDRVREEIESRRMHFMGGIHALEHAAIGIMPLLVMTDRNDLGGISIPFHPQTSKAADFVYDGIPGGLGLSKQGFDQAELLFQRTFETIAQCPCDIGCPCCVHSPKCGSGNRPIDKASALAILELIMGRVFKEDFLNLRITPTETKRPAPQENSLPKTVNRYGVLDIETRKSAAEVGGWNRAERMGVSCAVLYDSKSDEYHTYLQDEIKELEAHLKKLDLVIGFNIIRFDYKVLSGLSSFNFHELPTLDLLMKVHEILGYRLSLDHLAQQTLGAEKSADGLQALAWWKEGKLDEIITYCTQDVRVTRDLYRYGVENRFLLFKNKAGQRVRIPVTW